MRRLAIIISLWAMAVGSAVNGAPQRQAQKPKQPDTSYLEKWEPKKRDLDDIVNAVRSSMSNVKHDEIEWIGPYRWRDRITVIWLHYKYIVDGGTTNPVVTEKIAPFILKRSRSTRGDFRWEASHSRDRDIKRAITASKNKELTDKQITGKQVKPKSTLPPRQPPTNLRTWTDTTGKFSVEAELLDYRKGMVTLLTKDERAIRLKLSKLSKTDQRYVATRKK